MKFFLTLGNPGGRFGSLLGTDIFIPGPDEIFLTVSPLACGDGSLGEYTFCVLPNRRGDPWRSSICSPPVIKKVRRF